MQLNVVRREIVLFRFGVTTTDVLFANTEFSLLLVSDYL
ncbi:hypothetical protein ymoll0001_9850 [Yersinia mollaretii ATCC 43969]|uniref:Uncharacterized protein n=1 Tax=Yersinia mollaretii (strain ATCC 43969 / DSM 18520 / CIP 103324 / CNY 7263 / WAIP 204) TaxID=349967 RepID=A0ABM9YE97_YERMW|nr:hypothetical protein ymoll0001_9850 [Yersinia mollaretii ATCC 43969]